MKTTTSSQLRESPKEAEQPTEMISCWARDRGVQRLRMDRRIGPPDQEHLQQWSTILKHWAIAEPQLIFALLDAARAAADRSGEWRSWSFLTLQIQLAAERQPQRTAPPETIEPECIVVEEDPGCDWAIAKAKIRTQIGKIPFQNWFVQSRQVERQGAHITIAVPDEASRLFLEADYANLIRTALADLDIHDIQWTVRARACADNEFGPQVIRQMPWGLKKRGER